VKWLGGGGSGSECDGVVVRDTTGYESISGACGCGLGASVGCCDGYDLAFHSSRGSSSFCV
jgi:hypothetical protein